MDSHPLKMWLSVFGRVYRGSSAGRAMRHLRVKSDVPILGNAIDIGTGRRPLYLRYVDNSELTKTKAIDIGIADVATSTFGCCLRNPNRTCMVIAWCELMARSTALKGRSLEWIADGLKQGRAEQRSLLASMETRRFETMVGM